ncbi:DUF6286 domain-containing protein [Streptomyces sp. NBC_00344]|uniref:DUF6286 domain-containing protein n=1 Tax=Streptomyces sp. NBC_00344 TaxID=2975720 RepID=UPI002E1ADD6F
MNEPENTQGPPVAERAPDAQSGRSGSAPGHRPAAPAGRAKRFWSARRTPATLLALVVVGASGLLLYDVASVRAGRPAMHWRRVLADELATRPLDNIWIEVGAAAAMAVGLWLIVLAVTPGLRSVLPMRRENPQVRAGLERDAAALVLRDRAMEVPGVQSVQVRMKRSRVAARARSHFRELDDVRTDLDTALRAGITELGLATAPRLSVHVRRPARKG